MLALALTLMLVPAQEPSVELSRTEELRIAREEKARHLQPPSRSFLENGLLEFKERRIMERFQAGFLGFHPLLGGMKSGSGFAMGTSYDITKALKASAQVSLKGAQKYEVLFSAPHFLNDRIFAEVRSTYRNLPQETYFGTGNANTRPEDRTNYRSEDLGIGGQVGVRVRERVKVGTHIGWIKTTIGEGTSAQVPSVGEVFAPTDLPALDSQPTYLRTGAFVDADYRDEPGNPRAGGRYMAKWSSFQDRNLGRYDFSQYEMEVQQYFSFFNQRRVIALRAKTTFTQTGDGQQVPFYMLPTLGGSEDLRGFADFRFRDRNMVVFNAEYRWEAFSGLDLALFADAGQVAASARDIRVRDMKTAAGIGFRFNTAKKVFYRVDVGFSQEGTRVSMKFGNVF
jgi:outer membrane protein assembly factor BamA